MPSSGRHHVHPHVDPRKVLAFESFEVSHRVRDLALDHEQDRAEVRVRAVQHEQVGEPRDVIPRYASAPSSQTSGVHAVAPVTSIGERKFVVSKPVAKMIVSTAVGTPVLRHDAVGVMRSIASVTTRRWAG